MDIIGMILSNNKAISEIKALKDSGGVGSVERQITKTEDLRYCEFIVDENMGGLPMFYSGKQITLSSDAIDASLIAIVTWDNQVYRCAINLFDNINYQFGNENIINPDALDTGEPFYFIQSTDMEPAYFIMASKEPCKVLIKIQIEMDVITPIDGKFIVHASRLFARSIIVNDTLGLKSPSGKSFSIEVDDNGVLSSREI